MTRRARTARGGATPSAWRAIGQKRIEPAAARPFLSLKLDKSAVALSAARARSFDDLAKSPAARVYERVPSGPIRAYSPPVLFLNERFGPVRIASCAHCFPRSISFARSCALMILIIHSLHVFVVIDRYTDIWHKSNVDEERAKERAKADHS
jgi:hypothetical protein